MHLSRNFDRCTPIRCDYFQVLLNYIAICCAFSVTPFHVVVASCLFLNRNLDCLHECRSFHPDETKAVFSVCILQTSAVEIF